MKFVTKQLEMEAEVIVKVDQPNDVPEGTYNVTTETGRIAQVVWKESPQEGDYLNITNLDDIYHMPKHIVEGPNAKYETEDACLTVGRGLSQKTLSTCNAHAARKVVKDIEIMGNGDQFQLMCKASSKNEGWMKSTKAMEIEGVGCVVQTTTQQGEHVAEALVFVPGVKIVGDGDSGRRLEKYNVGDWHS